jgi:hypothetical protein
LLWVELAVALFSFFSFFFFRFFFIFSLHQRFTRVQGLAASDATN